MSKIRLGCIGMGQRGILMLENCCYGQEELTALNMARMVIFG